MDVYSITLQKAFKGLNDVTRIYLAKISNLGGSYNLMQIATKEILETNGISRGNTRMSFFFVERNSCYNFPQYTFIPPVSNERAWADGNRERNLRGTT